MLDFITCQKKTSLRIVEKWQQKSTECKLSFRQYQRFRQYQQEMSTLGNITVSDFTILFKQLYDGLSKNIEKKRKYLLLGGLFAFTA